MLDYLPFRWAVPLVLAVLLLAWHILQGRRFAAYMQRTGRTDEFHRRLLALSAQRSWQMTFLLALVCGYSAYESRQQHRLSDERDFWMAKANIAEKFSAAPLPEGEPEPEKPDLMSEEMQEKLDRIKERYEDLFVNYYYLERCNLATPSDFHIMNSSLLYELSLIDAPAGMRNSILQAARGTHQEMYGEAPCDAAATAPLKANVEQYLRSVIANVND